MTKRALIHEAQDQIIAHAVHAALLASEDDNEELAIEIRRIAAGIAKKWGLCDVPGLPDTFAKKPRDDTKPQFLKCGLPNY